jgi:hypothetical protein
MEKKKGSREKIENINVHSKENEKQNAGVLLSR